MQIELAHKVSRRPGYCKALMPRHRATGFLKGLQSRSDCCMMPSKRMSKFLLPLHIQTQACCRLSGELSGSVNALQDEWDEEQDPEGFRLGGSVPKASAPEEAGAVVPLTCLACLASAHCLQRQTSFDGQPL